MTEVTDGCLEVRQDRIYHLTLICPLVQCKCTESHNSYLPRTNPFVFVLRPHTLTTYSYHDYPPRQTSSVGYGTGKRSPSAACVVQLLEPLGRAVSLLQALYSTAAHPRHRTARASLPLPSRYRTTVLPPESQITPGRRDIYIFPFCFSIYEAILEFLLPLVQHARLKRPVPAPTRPPIHSSNQGLPGFAGFGSIFLTPVCSSTRLAQVCWTFCAPTSLAPVAAHYGVVAEAV